MRLLAQQRELPLETFATQRLDESPTAEASPNDDDVIGALEDVQRANMASHWSALAGTSARLCSRTSPIAALGSAEYR